MPASVMARVISKAQEMERSGVLRGPPRVWGPPEWDLLREVMQTVPCPSCREHGLMMLDGMHDLVNLHKGEKPERPQALCWTLSAMGKGMDLAGVSCQTTRRFE